MPILPIDADSNTWLICFSQKVNGEYKHFKGEFVGTIREAMSHEMQLRSLAKDGIDSIYTHI